MIVKELIEALQKEKPDAIVIMSHDSEGNGYSPLSSIDTDTYTPDSTWSGEVGLSGGQEAIILTPIN